MQNTLEHPTGEVLDDDDVVDPIAVVAKNGSLSISTFRRIDSAGEGPPTISLSKRRKGVRRRDWRAWLASRTRWPVPDDETIEPAPGRNAQTPKE
jgi:hypothetical protein